MAGNPDRLELRPDRDAPRHLALRPARAKADLPPMDEPAVAILDQKGVVCFCDPAVGRLLRRDSQELVGREASRIFPELPLKSETPGYNLAFAAFWGNAASWLEIEGLSSDGCIVPLEVSLRKLLLDGCPFILLSLRPPDATADLSGQLTRLEAVAESSDNAVMISDTDGIILYVNRAFEQMTGYRREEALGQPASLLKSGFHDTDFYDRMWTSLRLGHDFHALLANRKKTGEVFFEETHIRPFIDEKGNIARYVAIGHTVSEPLQDALLRLQHVAYHDALTGLPNRNLFMDRLNQAIARAQRRSESFALVYIDLDDFKEVNDTHGHAAGDSVLCTTARCLRSCIRDEDTAARLGGDEFGLILLNVEQAKAVEVVLEKVLSTLAQGAHFRDMVIPIRASLGASLFPVDGSDADTLLHHADCAMYSEKYNGRHGFNFFNGNDTPETASVPSVKASEKGLPRGGSAHR